MTIEEFTRASDIEAQIEAVRVKDDTLPEIEDLKKEWDVRQHKVIIDKNYLPDKELKNSKNESLGTKEVNRIATPFQKDIVKKAVVFGFGNPVEIEHNAEEGTAEERVLRIVERILNHSKIRSFDRRLAKDLYRGAEVAEFWYYKRSEEPHNKYGEPADFEVKVMKLSPWDGEELYPHFDEYNDMKLFARGFSSGFGEEKGIYLDVWTKEEYKRFREMEGKWIEDTKESEDGEEMAVMINLKDTINKIPVVYARQAGAEWEDVQYDIDRLELLFSRHAEINDYHASPKTFVRGNLLSIPQAGESGGVINGGQDSDAKILSWDSAPESIKLEISTRLSNIFKFTQTPDVSFDSVKGLNQVSGVMLKMLFMDAHIKVLEKQEIWDEYFTRRYNLLKAYVGKILYPELEEASKNLEMNPIFKPYMINDDKETIDNLMRANGGKPIIGHKKSIELAGLTNNPILDWEEIIEEQGKENEINLFEPTRL